MSVITIIRVGLIFAGAGSIFLVAKLVRAPKYLVTLVFRMCWIAGILNLIVDFFEQKYGFWHYTANGLVLGFPLDFYIAVSFFVGGSLCLVYWWVYSKHPKWVVPFMAVLPFYFVFEDYIAVTFTHGLVGKFDSPYWWIADFFCLIIIVWGTLFTFKYFASRDPQSSV